MKKLIPAALLAATAGLAVACTGPAPAPTVNVPAPASVQSSPTSSAAPAMPVPPLNDQGHMVKKVGERAGIANADGSTAVEFWITKITVDPKCDDYSPRDSGKHTLLVDVTVKTRTSDDPSTFPLLSGLLNTFAMSTRGTDGVTNQADFSMCSNPKALPSNYAANSTYTGQIEAETDDAHGTMILIDPSGPFTNGNGWEWPY